MVVVSTNFLDSPLLGEMITIMCFVGEGVSLEVVVFFSYVCCKVFVCFFFYRGQPSC